ncbi:hypothetical protein PIB30_019654 [Stylosanthes scabra]|uniref:AAA+ ATPase domain-containing protein n=1 Tax=Stylosanthes scabra TaxID=79078 RepID=A0ABU6S8T8_9FABA|nr:hypothetical protein [Stylosanthes scabra]
MRNAQQVLCHVNVFIHDGSAIVLTVANGSSKTILLRLLAGFSRPFRSSTSASSSSTGSLKNAITDTFTVLENVQWFERKRVQIARLIALDRPIWLLDEPSIALDDEGVKLLEYVISEHRKHGGLVIVATHLPIEIPDSMVLRLPPRFLRRMTFFDMLDRSDIM